MKNLKSFLKGFIIGFKTISHSLSIIVNTVLLLFVYLIGIGLTSLVAKFKRKSFFQARNLPDKDSYWIPLNLQKKKLENYYRQF